MKPTTPAPTPSFWSRTITTFALIATVGFASGCEVDQTRDGEMPDVDISVEEGQLPAYDVDGPDVDVGVRTKTVQIPKLVVVMEEEEIEVPYIDVDGPNADDNVEQTIAVEIPAEDVPYNVTIKEIYQDDDDLIVVTEIERLRGTLSDDVDVFTDQIVMNAPEADDITYYVIGDQPSDDLDDDDYVFVNSWNEVKTHVEGLPRIYSDS